MARDSEGAERSIASGLCMSGAAVALAIVLLADAVSRASRPGPPTPREMAPANRLSRAERARMLAVLTSD